MTRSPMRWSELCKWFRVFGASPATLNRRLHRAIEDGYVVKVADGLYQLTGKRRKS